MVHPSDLNCLSVLQFAVEVLRVRHVIVCGHYGCGGVRVAMSQKATGLTDHWLRPIKDIHRQHEARLADLADDRSRIDAMCEFNVRQQVRNVAGCNILQAAWARGQELAVHGWIYGLSDGLIRDLNASVSSIEQLDRYERLLLREDAD
jgi:carbonic anhydrase